MLHSSRIRASLLFALVAVFSSGWAQSQALSARDALKLAARNRPAVEAAKLKVEQARFRARAVGAPPATRLGIGYSSNAEIGATDQDAFLTQPIDVFGRTAAAKQSGVAMIQLAEATFRKELLDLQTEVLSALSDAVAAVKLSAAAEAILKNAEELYSAASRKFEEGKVAEVQQTRAGIEVMRARQNSVLRLTHKQAALKRLASELGTSVEETQLVSFPAMDALTAVDVANRPDLQLIAAEVKVAKAEIRVARASAQPEVELQGLRSPWRGEGTRFGARIQITGALFDFGRLRNGTMAAEKQVQAGQQSLKDAKVKAQAAIDAAMLEFTGAKVQVEEFRRILESTRTLVRKTQIGYVEGASTLIEVLEATRTLREVEEGLVEAEQRLAETNIALYKAAGVLLEGSI